MHFSNRPLIDRERRYNDLLLSTWEARQQVEASFVVQLEPFEISFSKGIQVIRADSLLFGSLLPNGLCRDFGIRDASISYKSS